MLNLWKNKKKVLTRLVSFSSIFSQLACAFQGSETLAELQAWN